MTGVATGVRGDESGLVARLSLEQKVRLLTGADSWVLHGESAVGLRPMVLSDGPAGVRGTRFDSANPSTSPPSPIGLAATWDERLVQELTRALGHEARAKGIDVILGPTVNIVRTPLNGRGFECFSEDPLLTSRIAVAYVRGVQSAGVGATVKHYVANDSETERRTYDARVSEQVLRELYLPPFEACVAEADVFLVMAAYNSVNGAFMTANLALLREVVIEGVEVAPRFAYQPRGYGIIQRTFDLHFGTTIDLLQIIKNKGMTQDTCFLQESLRFLTQVREPLAHHRSHTLGDLNLFEGSPAPASVLAIHVTALDQGPHYLLYEEGVALGMGMQQRGKLL